MALTKEDGSIVSGANTFASLAEIRSFASARGVTMPADDAALEVIATKAMDYLISKESRFMGKRVSAVQTLPFPRTGIRLNGYAVEPTTIPGALVSAQCALCMAIKDTDLMPVNKGVGSIKRRKVGDLETEYTGTGLSYSTPSSPLVDSFLLPFYSSSFDSPTVIRV